MAKPPEAGALIVIEQGFSQFQELRIPIALPVQIADRHAPPTQQRRKDIQQGWFVEASLKPGTGVRFAVQGFDVPRILEPGQELDLAELGGLKAAGGRQLRAEGQKILWRHRL